MRRECRERLPRHRLQRKPLVSDPGMYHGTCVSHVPWCMSGSLIRGGGENVPGIPGACATRNFKYLARDPWRSLWRQCNVEKECYNKIHARNETVLNNNILFVIQYALSIMRGTTHEILLIQLFKSYTFFSIFFWGIRMHWDVFMWREILAIMYKNNSMSHACIWPCMVLFWFCQLCGHNVIKCLGFRVFDQSKS